MKKKVCFMLIAVAALTGCRQQEQQEENAAAGFETMTVSKQDITLEQSYPAQIEGRQSVKIIPRVEGYLREIRVKEGQRVKKGQVLFVIDQAASMAEVKAAKANVAVTKAGVETAQLNYDSRQTLHKKNVVSDYDLRTATANLSMAKAQAQQAQAAIITVNPMNDGTQYVVTSGLAVGDVIVSKGASYVREGQGFLLNNVYFLQ